MSGYYYTVASLPTVRFDDEPFHSYEGFIEICRVEVSDEDLRELVRTQIAPASPDEAGETAPGGVAARWRSWQREFVTHLAHHRAQGLGWDTDRLPPVDTTDPSIPELVRQVAAEDDPLRRELVLLAGYWNAVESLSVGHHFDLGALIGYSLKLQIAKRRAMIAKSDDGRSEYERQYAHVGQSLMEISR